MKNIKVLSVKILKGTGLRFSDNEEGLWIDLPEKPIDVNNTVVVIEIDKEAAGINPINMEGS